MKEFNFRRLMLGLFALALNISISATQIIAALFLIEWGWKFFRKDPKFYWKRSEVDFPILLFASWAFLSSIVHQTVDLRNTLGSQSAFLLFFWAAQSMDKEEMEHLFKWICWGAVVAGIWGILQVWSQVIYLPYQDSYLKPQFMSAWPHYVIRQLAVTNERALGSRSHPLTYAESFIPGFFLLLGMIIQKMRAGDWHWGKMGMLWFSLILMSAGIIFAQGRAVWLGIGLGVLLFGWAVGRKFFFQSTLFIALSFIGVMAVSPQLRGRFLSAVSSTSGSQSDQYSKSTRYTLWHESMESIRYHPFAGMGLESVRLTSLDPITHLERVWTETHNMFLQITLELGLIGLGLFLWILFLLARMIWRLTSFWRPALVGMFAAFLFAGLTESWPKDKEIAMLFWLLMGCVALLKRNEEA